MRGLSLQTIRRTSPELRDIMLHCLLSCKEYSVILQVPDDVATRFAEAMGAAGVDDAVRPHLHRWLRFYLDFCTKYGFESLAASSFSRFNNKLRDKGQAEWKRRQAFQAVELYRRLALGGQSGNDGSASQAMDGGREKHADDSSDSMGGVGRSGRRSVGLPVPGNRAAVQNRAHSTSRPQRVASGSSGDDASARAHGDRISAPPVVGERGVETTDQPKSQTTRRPTGPPGAVSDDPVPTSNLVAEKNTHGGPDMTTVGLVPAVADGQAGRSWVDLYEKLETAIKVRHYSPKTLKSYRSWARKF